MRSQEGLKAQATEMNLQFGLIQLDSMTATNETVFLCLYNVISSCKYKPTTYNVFLQSYLAKDCILECVQYDER